MLVVSVAIFALAAFPLSYRDSDEMSIAVDVVRFRHRAVYPGSHLNGPRRPSWFPTPNKVK